MPTTYTAYRAVADVEIPAEQAAVVDRQQPVEVGSNAAQRHAFCYHPALMTFPEFGCQPMLAAGSSSPSPWYSYHRS
jgi:hypothetical protein